MSEEQKKRALSALTGAIGGFALGSLGVLCVIGATNSIFGLMLIVFAGLLTAILGAVIGGLSS